MKKISIIGLFCTGNEVSDGQSIKTRVVAQEIEKNIGPENVRRIDTYGWKKRPFRLFFTCIKSVYTSKNIAFMTDAGGIKIFPWLLTCANIFAKKPIYYIVIGGWLVNYAKAHKITSFFLKKLDGVFVETSALRDGLENLGFKNIYSMPNFKDIQPLKKEQLFNDSKEPYRFCIFSRIMREKGIECAVKAVENVNTRYGRKVCTLDLYGGIDADQIAWFDQFKNTFSDAVKYYGIIPFDKSVEVLKDYYALLFPTQFYTEGIPGTIIDAYAAGLPVIASEWESVYDIVDPDVTGITFPFKETEVLQECMMRFIENPQQVFGMRENCLKKVEQYLPDAVMNIFLSKLK